MPVLVGSDASVAQVRNIRPAGSQLGETLVLLDEFVIGAVHSSGANVHLGALDGWFSPTASTVTVTQRTAADGAWLDEAHRTAREIGVTVHIDGGTWAVAGSVLDELIGRIPVTSLASLVVVDGGRALTSEVQQVSEVVVARSAGRATVSIALVAPDPRRYGLNVSQYETGLPFVTGGLVPPVTPPVTIIESSDSGKFTARNDGNMSTSPVFTLYGPCPAWSITHLGLGKRLWSNTPIPAGRSLVLDAGERTARLDGTALRPVSGSWFDFAPGDNEVAFTASSYDSGALLEVSYRSAWR